MVPKKEKKKVVLVCRNCGYKEQGKGSDSYKFSTSLTQEKAKEIVVEEKREETLPTTSIQCPKCGNMEAYWWVQQTRSGDEPPTRFFKCKKCGYTWREYQ